MYTVGLVGVPVLIAVNGAVTAIWQVPLMFLVGWFVSPLQAAVVTILQTGVVDEERGRIMSVLNAAMSSTTVLSMAFAGIAGEIVGVRTVFFLAGGIVAIGAAIALIGFRGSESAEPSLRATASTSAPGMLATAAD